ncbi:tRNA 2-thiouridine(34) synthase MnmA [bacterium]|nr:tRNA 2-thiouridine(34) synthase MnmA [bacterium]
MKIAVAISGGVDSAVSAKLLSEQGHDVVLCHFLMSDAGEKGAIDARRVAEHLKRPFFLLDLRNEFEGCVVRPFIEEYLRARTPNPCVNCNPNFKFKQLIAFADKEGCDRVATGHYAIVKEGRLFQAKNQKKDQSYFLSRLSAEQLKRIVFPLGGYAKEEVRKLAADYGIPVAAKHDSQEICFIPGDDYEAFLRERAPESFVPGDILDTEGNVVGKHVGLPSYTIGQRKKIGAHLVRKYVVRIDKENNSVVIGGNEDLEQKIVTLSDTRWLRNPESDSFEAEAKIRSVSAPKKCLVRVLPNGLTELEFAAPERAAAKGQAGVIYRSGEVLGAGIIKG